MKIMPADAPSKLARIGLANSTALRRHFVELTRAVLEPFSPYCRGNGPPPGQVRTRLHCLRVGICQPHIPTDW